MRASVTDGTRSDDDGERGAVATASGGAVTTDPMVRVVGLSRTYGTGTTAVHALKGVDLAVAHGELVALVGRSGSGKTTLLNCIGGLDRPDSGQVYVDGHEVTALDERGLVRLRRDVVAFVFQTFGLIPILSAAENVGLPLRLRRTPARERDARVALLLDRVGLARHAEQRPGELSGGQQQRVAVARALANRARLLIADEPTGQLDTETGRSVMRLLKHVVRSEGMTGIVATHDPMMIEMADRVVSLHDGHLVEGLSTHRTDGVAS